jgi:hypothetical protein
MKTVFHVFWHVCAALLAGTALLKLWMLAHTPGHFAIPDPSLPGLALRDSLLLAVVLEFLCAGLLLFSRSGVVKALVLLWWCVLVLIYRAGYPPGANCPCLGNLPDLLGLRPGTGSAFSLLLLCLFAFGSAAALLFEWRQRRRFTKPGASPSTLMLGLFCLASGAYSGNASAAPKRTEALRVVGVCQRTGIDWRVMKAHTEAGTFTLTVSPSHLEIVVTITNTPLNHHPRVIQYEYRTDGTDSVNLGRFDLNVAPEDYVYPVRDNGALVVKTNNTPVALKNQCHIFLTPWSLPHGYVNAVLPMALAFGWQPAFAKYYSANEGPSLIDFSRPQRGKLDEVRVSIRRPSFTEGVGPSSLVSFYSDGTSTNDFFSATEFKQFSAGRFPTVLRYVHYVEPSLLSKLPAGLLFDWQVTASVTGVEKLKWPVQDLMRFGSCTGKVEDTRFAVLSKDPIPVVGYLTTNGVLPSRQIVMQKQFYQQETHAARRDRRASRFRLLLLAALMLAFPIALVMRGKWRKTQQEP